MAQTVTLQRPDEMLQRCQRGAMAARKLLEEFLVDRLMEALPPALVLHTWLQMTMTSTR